VSSSSDFSCNDVHWVGPHFTSQALLGWLFPTFTTKTQVRQITP